VALPVLTDCRCPPGSLQFPRVTLEELLAGVPHVIHAHAPAYSVPERQALPFPWERAVKTLAFTSGATVALVALVATDRVDMGSLARALGVSRSSLAPATEDVLGRLGYAPGGVAPVSPEPGVRCLLDARTLALPQPVFCGAATADKTLAIDANDLARVARCEVVEISSPRSAGRP
jgi:prolyl-tRNA editing enzyme YbaK/EbsC (Cys-tRNA(Pro) deacylase)